jgi:hypothetical protein
MLPMLDARHDKLLGSSVARELARDHHPKAAHPAS